MMILLFIMATVGMTNVIIWGKIMDLLGIRPWLKRTLKSDWYELFECHECTGWWCGLIMGALLISWNPLVFIPCAFAGAFLGRFYLEISQFIESKTDFVIEVENEGSKTQ